MQNEPEALGDPPKNFNQRKLAAGFKFRLDIHAANMMRSAPEFATSLKDARGRRKQLREVGYVVTIFSITASGGLVGVG